LAVKKVKVEDAVGKPLAHDTVRFAPGVKNVLFKRGHVVTAADVERLKNTGDYFVYVTEGKEEGVHEDEAALRMARASAGKNVFGAKPNQGKVNLLAKAPGLLKVKADVIKRINLINDFVFSTRLNNTAVRKGGLVGSVKIVPLMVAEGRMRRVEGTLKRNKPVLRVILLRVKKVSIIVTGTEVYEKRIKDAFLPVLREKLAGYGLKVRETVVVPDDDEKIKEKILEFRAGGCELVLVAGGMAVDAEDVTPAAIRKTGARVVSRGVPIFPGSMMMLAYLGGTAVMGLPACVFVDKRTSFDILLPRVLAKEKVTKAELAELGHGGLL